MKITLDKKKSARRGGIHVATATLFAKDFVFENYVIVCLSLITFFRGRPISFLFFLFFFVEPLSVRTPIAQ